MIRVRGKEILRRPASVTSALCQTLISPSSACPPVSGAPRRTRAGTSKREVLVRRLGSHASFSAVKPHSSRSSGEAPAAWQWLCEGHFHVSVPFRSLYSVISSTGIVRKPEVHDHEAFALGTARAVRG
jgi:hypothetical protein